MSRRRGGTLAMGCPTCGSTLRRAYTFPRGSGIRWVFGKRRYRKKYGHRGSRPGQLRPAWCVDPYHLADA